jgi:hypothetical protein
MKTLLQAAFISLVAPSGTASVMLAPGTVLPGQAYIDKGAEFADRVVAIRRVSASGVVSYASGIKLTPYHVLLPAHVIDSLSGFRPPERLRVLIGSNFFSPLQTLDVVSYVTHPTYISGSNSVGGSVYDMAVLKISIAMPPPFASLAAISPPNGTTITYAGYGMPGLSLATATSHDGNLRSFQGTSTSTTGFLFDDAIYGATFASSTLGLPLAGSGSVGDSGAAGFTSDNDVAFMATSGSGDNFTFGVDLTNPTAREFITANTVMPDPPQLAIALVATSAQLSLSNLLSGREYRVMRSPTLSNWQEAFRFTATVTSYSWSEAISPIGRTFYRLEWNE